MFLSVYHLTFYHYNTQVLKCQYCFTYFLFLTNSQFVNNSVTYFVRYNGENL